MNKTKLAAKSLLIVACSALVIGPIASFAKGESRGPGPRVEFETLDTDQNGEITVEEMVAHTAVRFSEVDTDGDGFLSLEEVSAKAEGRRAKRAERMFERRDANADGKLSVEEMSPQEDRIAKRFERADSDGNGSLSKAEFEEAGKKGRGRDKRASK